MGQALFWAVTNCLERAGKPRLRGISAPACCQGYFWGNKGNLVPAWGALGLKKADVSFQPLASPTMLLYTDAG